MFPNTINTYSNSLLRNGQSEHIEGWRHEKAKSGRDGNVAAHFYLGEDGGGELCKEAKDQQFNSAFESLQFSH